MYPLFDSCGPARDVSITGILREGWAGWRRHWIGATLVMFVALLMSVLFWTVLETTKYVDERGGAVSARVNWHDLHWYIQNMIDASILGAIMLLLIGLPHATMSIVAVGKKNNANMSIAQAFGRTLRRLPVLLGIYVISAVCMMAVVIIETLSIRYINAVHDLTYVTIKNIVLCTNGLSVVGFTSLYLVAAPCCVAEQLGPIASLRRAMSLTKGHRLRILGVFILLGLIGGLIFQTGKLLALVMGAQWVPTTNVVITVVYGGYLYTNLGALYARLGSRHDGPGGQKLADVFT